MLTARLSKERALSIGHPAIGRTAASILLAVLALTAVPAPVTAAAAGAATDCLVRNVTQDTSGRSFRRLVAAAQDGDRLRVRGTCTSAGVVIDRDLVIQGVGVGATLQGRSGSRRRVLKVTSGAGVVLRDLVVEGGRLACPPACTEVGGAGILNLGRLTLLRVVVQGNRGRGVFGLGISNRGSLTLRHSVVRWNRGGLGDGGAAINNEGSLVMRHSHVRDNDQTGIYNIGVARVVDSVVAGHRVGYEAQDIANDGTMTLIRSSIRANTANGDYGGGIENFGALSVRDSVIRDNGAEDGWGGGIWKGGTLTVVDSVIRRNTAGEQGGGITNWGTLTIRDSVIRDNRSGGYGGGLWNTPDGSTAVVEGSRIVGNRSRSRGGGIGNFGDLTLVDTVVRYNRAAKAGGGIYNDPSGTVALHGSSSVTDNVPDDCVGTSAC